VAVAVDVQRVGTGHLGEVGGRVGDVRELEGAPNGAVVVEQGGRVGAAGQVDIGEAVVVAVEDGDASADEEQEVAVVAVLDAGGGRFLDQLRRCGGRRRLVGGDQRRTPKMTASANAAPPTTPPASQARSRLSTWCIGPSGEVLLGRAQAARPAVAPMMRPVRSSPVRECPVQAGDAGLVAASK